MPRPLSDSWQYFELLAPDNGRSRKARCSFCGHEQAAGITRLHQHLLYRCSRITPDIREELRQKHGDRGRDSPPKGSELLSHSHHSLPHTDSVNYHFDSALQNTLNSNNNNSTNNNANHQSPTNMNPHSTYYEAALSPTASTNFSTANPIAFPSSNPPSNSLGHQPPHHQHHQQQQQQQQERSQSMLDCQLARAFFAANIPFESIENPHMIDFLKRLQPNYIVPKGRRLKQYILKEQHWDLIPWENDPDLILNRQAHSPPPPMLQQQQQQQRRMMLTTDGSNGNADSNLSNRLLSSLHPPADLEGSL